MSDLYVLKDGLPIPEDDSLAWSLWFETADRRVALTKMGDVEVSTVFLGIDHSFGGGPPLLYETLVFGGPLDGEMERYSTLQEAEAGHQRMVARVSGEVVHG